MTNLQINSEGKSRARARDFTEASQIAVLAESTRLAIYSAVAWGGARTVREVAQRLGRHPGSLYRHFDVLVSAGMLEQTGTVATARRSAKTYRAPADSRIVYRAGDHGVIDALNRVVWSSARNAARGFSLATEQGRATTNGPARDTYMGTQSGWLNEEELEEYNRRVDELRVFLQSRGKREGTTLVESTVVMFPPITHQEEDGEGS